MSNYSNNYALRYGTTIYGSEINIKKGIMILYQHFWIKISVHLFILQDAVADFFGGGADLLGGR